MTQSRIWSPQTISSAGYKVSLGSQDSNSNQENISYTLFNNGTTQYLNNTIANVLGFAERSGAQNECNFEIADFDSYNGGLGNGTIFVNATIDFNFTNIITGYQPFRRCKTVKISPFNNVEGAIQNLTIVGGVYLLNLDLCPNLTAIELSQTFGSIRENARIDNISSNIKFFSVNSSAGINISDFNMSVNYANGVQIKANGSQTVAGKTVMVTLYPFYSSIAQLPVINQNSHNNITTLTDAQMTSALANFSAYSYTGVNYNHSYLNQARVNHTIYVDIPNLIVDGVVNESLTNIMYNYIEQSGDVMNRLGFLTQRTMSLCYYTNGSIDYTGIANDNCSVIVYSTPQFSMGSADNNRPVLCDINTYYDV